MFRKHKSARTYAGKPGIKPDGSKTTKHPQASFFPEVGMTLSTYNTQPFGAFRSQSLPAGRWQRLRSKITKKRVILAIITLLVLLIGWLGWKFIYNGSKIFGGNIFSILDTTRLKGEDVGQVNILLAGNSADDPGHGGAELTDSIMLISLDTRHNKAYLVSIPRDLWVNVPGYGYQKINQAYVDGQEGNFHEAGYAKGGMGLLEKVVSQDLQMPINYYALVNYAALKDAVNAVGGIDITVKSQDPRGLYDPSIDWSTNGPLVSLTNGPHHLNGEQALDLARARGDAYGSYGFPASDFDRTAHQQQLIVALKSKILSSGTLANPIKLSNLFDSFGKNIRTNFQFNEVHRLYQLSQKISNSNIKSLTLNNANGVNLLTSYAAPDGESALIPAAGVDNYSAIILYLKRAMSSDPVIKEDAKVVILNGTNTYGLASKASQKLQNKGIEVMATGNASTLASQTTVISTAAQTAKPATAQYLKGLYGGRLTTTNPYAGMYSGADFIIVLGTDQIVQ